jgi:hypothetical protein
MTLFGVTGFETSDSCLQWENLYNSEALETAKHTLEKVAYGVLLCIFVTCYTRSERFLTMYKL